MATKNKTLEVSIKKSKVKKKVQKPQRKEPIKELPFLFYFVVVKTADLKEASKKEAIAKVRGEATAGRTFEYFDNVPPHRGHSVIRVEASRQTGKVTCVYEVAYDAAAKGEEPRYETRNGKGWMWLPKEIAA